MDLLDDESDESKEMATTDDAMKQLYESNTGDITISLADGQIKVISNLLSRDSIVFRKMFLNSMSEKNTKQIDLKDYKATLIRDLLKYIYYRHIYDCKNPDTDEWFEMLQIADMYQLKRYTDTIAYQISIRITDENVYQIICNCRLVKDITTYIETKAIEYLQNRVIQHVKSRKYVCYDKTSSIYNMYRYCCKCEYKKGKQPDFSPQSIGMIPTRYCYCTTATKHIQTTYWYSQRCCLHSAERDTGISLEELARYPEDIKEKINEMIKKTEITENPNKLTYAYV
jgi:hypothetical protein